MTDYFEIKGFKHKESSFIQKFGQKKNADLGSASETFVNSVHTVKNSTKLYYFL